MNFYKGIVKYGLWLFLIMVMEFVFVDSPNLLAQQDISTEQQDALGEMMALMDVDLVTDLSTKTRLNPDFAPGMVTILNGKELEEQGVKNSLEALRLIPGIDAFEEMIIVRGVNNDDNSTNKLLILLNNIPMNVSAVPIRLPILPIEMIDRIEMIRGPGSVIYGKFAYSGVINIITRSQETSAYGRYGSFDSHQAGAMTSYRDFDNDVQFNLNISNWKRDRTGIITGPDASETLGVLNITQAPGPVNDKQAECTAVLNGKYHDLSLLFQYNQSGIGNGYGKMHVLPPLDDRRVEHNSNYMADIAYKFDLFQSITTDIHLGTRYYIFDIDSQTSLPPGLIIPIENGEYAFFEDGMIDGPHVEEQSLYTKLSLYKTVYEKHDILFGIDMEHLKLRDIWTDTNYNPITGEPQDSIARFSGEFNWLKEGQNRTISSAYLQDQFRLIDYLTITGGIRADAYSDTDDRVTPRISGVYNVTDQHIFKAQYAQAFRPPTFLELYVMNNPVVQGNPDLKAQLIDTYELAYIFRETNWILRNTVFYSKMKKNIYTYSTFINRGKTESRGAETELKWDIGSRITVNSNLSYMITENLDTNRELLYSSTWLGNAMLTYRPFDRLSSSVHYYFSSKRHRDADDDRKELKGYHAVNFTVAMSNVVIRNVSLKTGVYNVFDTDIRYPSRPIPYDEDCPTPGRQWWVQ
ncbi:MAG: TonB-dependent receptor, partial [Desulfobacterales bacterium]|nr:TonB-dependent receptor [Desulfobacterales bacterium]